MLCKIMKIIIRKYYKWYTFYCNLNRILYNCRIKEKAITNYFAQTCQHSNVRKCVKNGWWMRPIVPKSDLFWLTPYPQLLLASRQYFLLCFHLFELFIWICFVASAGVFTIVTISHHLEKHAGLETYVLTTTLITHPNREKINIQVHKSSSTKQVCHINSDYPAFIMSLFTHLSFLVLPGCQASQEVISGMSNTCVA